MKLIDNAKQAWKLFSVQIAGLAVVWAMLPLDQQAAALGLVGLAPERASAVLGVMFLVARLIKQTPEEPK